MCNYLIGTFLCPRIAVLDGFSVEDVVLKGVVNLFVPAKLFIMLDVFMSFKLSER